MNWEITPAASILLLISAVVAGATWLIWRRRTAPGGGGLLWLMLAVWFWTFTGAIEATSVGLDQKIFWSKLSYLGIAPSAPLLLIFTLIYTRRQKWITPRRMVILWAVPVLTVFLAATNEYHNLIWSKIVLHPASNLLIYNHGPAFWVYTVYAYLCVAAADVLLIGEYRQAAGSQKAQVVAVLISTFFPWLGNIIYVSGLDPIPGLDTSIVFSAATAVILSAAIFQSGLLNLLPIAHDVLLQQMQDGVIVIDSNNRVAEANPAAAFLLDKLALPLGERVAETFAQWPPLAQILLQKPKLPAEISLDGTFPRYLDVRVTSITDLHGTNKDGILVVLRDITDRRRAETAAEAKSRELERMTITDDLTTLYNRRHANRFLEQQFQICERYGHPLSLVLLDLDDFKRINDGFGHLAGDKAICSVANILLSNIRGTDLAARIGGDEFLMVMPNTSTVEAWPMVERIRTAIRDEFLSARQTQITISAGITSWFRGETPDEALKRVDRLLYQAKEHGKNCIVNDDLAQSQS